MFKSTFGYIIKERFSFLFVVLFFISSVTYAQTNISGIVNSYTSVTGVNVPICNACDLNCTHTITVADASDLAVGDKALIIQMKGATISTANSSVGGSITAINSAGNYEFIEIASISGNVLTPRYPLIRTYNVAGKVQVVKIPNYTSANINATLTSLDWNDAAGIGGVVAISARTLIFNADIDVNGRGFSGIQMNVNGTPNNCNLTPSSQFVLPDTNVSSYTRGEGIALFNPGTDRGRAPRANGGGSGVSGDSGGGGGGNYGAGGAGGRRWCNQAPGGANAGGIGGYSMTTYLAQDKAFLGGAGGPGWVSTSNPSTAADGGGIVIIFADEIIGNGHFINANGLSPLAVNPTGAPDGGGGGGAGGSVVLKVNRYTTNLTVNINGGEGQDLNTNDYHGPGGGGGGGVLLYSKASLPVNVVVNATGGIGGQHLDGFRNDSQNGAVGGTISLYIPIENPNYVGNADTDSIPENCDLDDDNDGILDTVEYGALPDPFGDSDLDKIPNYFDPSSAGFVDTNADGIDDRYDTDLDGVLNQLDLDSDNDGCSDANEYYNSIAADGGDGGVYGTGIPTVDASGRVNGPVAAPYSGTYTNVISLGSASVLNPSTPSDQSTAVGGNVSFTTTITTLGSGTTQHQWQLSTDNGASWSNIANGGVYSGATTATLSITTAVVSMTGYDYRDIVTQSNYVCGVVTSAGANLCVINTPTATAQSFCSVDAKTVSDIVATGTAIKWYNAATAGTQYAGTATLATGTYYASQTVSGCESARTSVAVTVNPFSGTADNTTANTAICETGTKTLSATPAGGTWSVVSGGGSISGTAYTPADVSADTNVTVR
ncbi:MAG: large repetitive protein, partial [Bacteroidota bacterium]|nr:large repetitive protein [Bacteroidota bacterium]